MSGQIHSNIQHWLHRPLVHFQLYGTPFKFAAILECGRGYTLLAQLLIKNKGLHVGSDEWLLLVLCSQNKNVRLPR